MPSSPRSPRSDLLTLCLLLAAAAASCRNGSAPVAAAPAPMLLTAGLAVIEPAPGDTISARVDLHRVGLGGAHPLARRTYHLTTPAGVPFAFDVVTLAEGNAGWVKVALAQVQDGTATPTTGAEGLASAGVIANGPGLFFDGPDTNWLAASGSGFTRMSVRGQIDRPQVFALETEVQGFDPATATFAVHRQTALLELAIGPRSAINAAADASSTHPDIVDDTVIYSSDSWRFGMPAIAVSGDRASLVVYEGDRNAATRPDRYEMRLQHDGVTGAVTGGGAESVGLDSGNWRDHEIAALFNVLAVAQGTGEAVDLRLSFDRGASFAQTEQFAIVGGAANASSRLVQVAMAGDYGLALAYWRVDEASSQLMLIEGRPSAFDATGSPAAYAFTPAVSIHRVAYPVVPLPMGMQWSEGGDLVIGHAYTYTTAGGIWTGSTNTEFHCAVRPWRGEFTDTTVDIETMFGRDPSVALLGSGPGLRVYYAYETRAGVNLMQLDAAGQLVDHARAGGAGAYAPSVFAREQNGAARVDLFYIADTPFGFELQSSRWQVFGGSPEEHFRLSTARLSPSVQADPQIGSGYRLQQLAWFGYDAVRDGDDIVLAIDEETVDALTLCLRAPQATAGTLSAPGLPPTFSNAAPPPLAPGLTEPVPAPDASHRHQLRLVRIR